MNGFAARLGKAEGIVACAILFFATLVGLKGFQQIEDATFLAAVLRLFEIFFGGSALAAFRDWKKNGNSVPTNGVKEGQ